MSISSNRSTSSHTYRYLSFDIETVNAFDGTEIRKFELKSLNILCQGR